MKRGRIPLTALRSFEAAGRWQSFTRASEELFVSQAAISRQVRDLEQSLGKALFVRAHRQVTLTTEGEKLLDTLSRSFDAIEVCLQEIIDEETSPILTISVEPGFAYCWLTPELKHFRDNNREIDVSIESEGRLVNLKTHKAELAIRFGKQPGHWQDAESKHFYDSEMFPVVSPLLFDSTDLLSKPSDLMNFTLLHECNREDWKHWFSISGIKSGAIERGPIYDDGALTLQAALDGQGVAMAEKQFAANHIASGRLIKPFDISLKTGAYWLVARDFTHLSESATKFVQWVEKKVALIN